MRFWVWGAVLAGGLALADWGAGQGLAAWLRGALDGSGAAGAAQVTATGFPTRIGVQLQAPHLTEAGRTVLALERAGITAPVWNPLSWRLDLPLPQRITLQGLPFEATGTRAALQLDLAPGLDLPLAGIALDIDRPALQLAAAKAPSLAAESVDLALRPTGEPRSYSLAGEIVGAERVGQQFVQRARTGRVVDQHLGAAVFQQHLTAPSAGHQRGPGGVDTGQRDEAATTTGDQGAGHSTLGAET